jgi:hypothetical protein
VQLRPISVHDTNLFRMPDELLQRGAKPLSDRDWLFGSRPRRKLLEAVLTGSAPKTGWTRPELASMAGVVANGGVDAHVDGATRLGLLTVEDAGAQVWRLAQPTPDLAKALRRVLAVLGSTSDAVSPRPRAARTGVATAAQALRSAQRAVAAARDELAPGVADELVGLLQDAGRRLH